MGPTSVQGYDSEGNKQWFVGGIPAGYTGSPPEIKEPEIPAPVITPPKQTEPSAKPKEEKASSPKVKSKPSIPKEPSVIPASEK